MNETESRYCDEAYELAIEKIESMYADTTVEILKNSSFDHLPRDIIVQLDIAQAKIDNRGKPKTIPLGKFTMSDDGKTCNECSSDLVVKNSTVSDSAGVRTIQKLNCPKGCNRLTNSMNEKRNQFNKVIEDSKNLTKDCKSIYKLNTRGYDIQKAHDILRINMEHGHKVSVVNDQFTELNFGLIPVFESKEKFNKKTGKVIEYVKCEHELDDYLKTIEESKIYKVLKVEKIGNLCNIRQWDYGMKPCECDEIRTKIKRKIDQGVRDGLFDYNDYKQHYKIEKEFNTDVVYFKITVQRVDAEIPKVILKVLSHKRFKRRNLEYFKSAEVTRLVIAQLDYLQVPDTLRAKVTSQLKKLSNDGDLEIKYVDWDFNPFRHQSSIELKPDMENQVSRFYGNADYIGTEAKKLNHYRISDNYAVYLTKPVLSQLKSINKELKRVGYSNDPVTKGFELAMMEQELIFAIAKQITGLNDKMDIVYYNISGQVMIASKSGIKRKRK